MSVFSEWPKPFVFKDGRAVRNVGDWQERREEILADYQTEMYGRIRKGEKVSFELADEGAMLVSFFGAQPAPDAKKMTVLVKKSGEKKETAVNTTDIREAGNVVDAADIREAGSTVNSADSQETENVAADAGISEVSFDTAVFLPTDGGRYSFPGGSPVIICMHPIGPIKYANEHGYAVIVMNPAEIASDDYKHDGCFYRLYPYGEKDGEQTGVLAAWGWGASKVLDALFAGAGEKLGINPKAAIVTGVSRWGKATAVCGAFDERFRMVAPSCSGAGGLALYRYKSEGKTFDFSTKENEEKPFGDIDKNMPKMPGAPDKIDMAHYTYGQNEPLSCLQSDGERGWFNDRFVGYRSEADLPLEQYMLPALCADKNRLYFVIASCINEDWVNAPSMWACCRVDEKIFDFLGVRENLAVNIHKEGHAVIGEDMGYMIEFFNEKVYGIKSDKDLSALTTSVFEERANKDFMIDEMCDEVLGSEKE